MTHSFGFSPRNTPIDRPIKIMPLGDSITDGYLVPGGYRIDLWHRLNKRGYPFRFVGSRRNGPDMLTQKQHEGHSGWTIDQIRRQLEGWLTQSQPDIILLIVGTNDMIRYHRVEGAVGRLRRSIDEIFSHLPQASLLVASLPPIGQPSINERVLRYNNQMKQLIARQQTPEHHLHFVDLHPVFNLDDLPDGIHPNREGFRKMAIVWDTALVPILNQISARLK
ncbi:SGNH hydrolase [Oscillatoriales cyanobacterium LEGE 11467]|uniref:SGNH hydrolase n=1 Tax=Zarconia navalis LEGE 11467 TaxID=1828826 RepID=A0A928VVA7_9CYAN|nr:SGNH/GDSL hydrolase family protein [Zarconia navalis]MBE9040902.1 SGNH hydrolase [Zarconia navalis LEGE 11467]